MKKQKHKNARTAKYLGTVNALEVFQAYKRMTFDLLDARKGHYILDVGCGTGDDVRTLAQTVGDTGRVIGIDGSETMIAEAQRRTKGSNLPVIYYLGDARKLVFADNTFDGCRADRVFPLLEDPRQVLAEIIRVSRPAARIVVSGLDHETLVVDSPDRTLTRKILNFWCDNGIWRNGWTGRQLLGLFKEFELICITVVPVTTIMSEYSLANKVLGLQSAVERAQEAGVISAVEAVNWLDHLKSVSQAGRFFSAITGFIVAGKKP